MMQDPITLYVALDEKHEAKGVLYEDDGASYDYSRGCFRFSSTKFWGSTLRNAPSKPHDLSFWSTITDGSASSHDESCHLPTEARIERIVIMGLEKDVTRVAVSSDDATYMQSGHVRAHMHSLQMVDENMELDFSFGKNGELIIREPHVLMHSHWSILVE
jgi:hypothetical protein